MMDLSWMLLYFGLPFGVLGGGLAAFLFLTPYGAPILTLLANSKIARAALAIGAAALAICMACLKAYNSGKSTGGEAVVKRVETANAEAKADKVVIAKKVAVRRDDDLRAELKGWSK